VVIKRGELWWADLGEPRGSAPALRRPILVLQSDAFNRSGIGTTVAVSLTSNLKLAAAPGNVVYRGRGSGLSRPSVINVSQISTLDRSFLLRRIGAVPPHVLREVEDGVKLVLGLGSSDPSG
jgi:mRNA interferase MazF